jgi:hypothetical protein
LAAKRLPGDLPSNAPKDSRDSALYEVYIGYYRKECREFETGQAKVTGAKHLENCVDYAGELGKCAERMGIADLADFWGEETVRYGRDLEAERKKDAPPPREMKALRFDPTLYSETKTIALELVKTTLTAYIEEAMREKNERVLSDPKLRRELENRRRFEKERAQLEADSIGGSPR